MNDHDAIVAAVFEKLDRPNYGAGFGSTASLSVDFLKVYVPTLVRTLLDAAAASYTATGVAFVGAHREAIRTVITKQVLDSFRLIIDTLETPVA